jgi:hypothetical protein
MKQPILSTLIFLILISFINEFIHPNDNTALSTTTTTNHNLNSYYPKFLLVTAASDNNGGGGGGGDDDDNNDPDEVKKKAEAEIEEEIPTPPERAEPWLSSTDKQYAYFLALLMCGCGYMIQQAFSKRGGERSKTTPEFRLLQRDFLIGFGLNVAADWIQGPYVYKLYSFYGFSKGEIGVLFVVGFVSSLIFGSITAGLADRLGRKKICIAYSIVYSLACLTKHSTNFKILLGGRILAGIATSILHSGFESWYVAEHKNEAYPEEWMTETLGWCSFLKGLVAILAGMISSIVAHKWGFVAPFDVGTLLLICGGIWIHFRWRENYGDKNAPHGSNFATAWLVVVSNPKVWLLGFIQSCFEGAMYVFVFSWTPTLESTTLVELPHGIVFASFMVCIMIGSHAFTLLLSSSQSVEEVATMACAISSVVLFFPAITESHKLLMLAFCGFEICVGLYFPSIAVQRARYIPNEVRATVMAIFRIPLNVIVILALLNVSQLSTSKIALYSSGLLLAATVGERALAALIGSQSSSSSLLLSHGNNNISVMKNAEGDNNIT